MVRIVSIPVLVLTVLSTIIFSPTNYIGPVIRKHPYRKPGVRSRRGPKCHCNHFVRNCDIFLFRKKDILLHIHNDVLGIFQNCKFNWKRPFNLLNTFEGKLEIDWMAENMTSKIIANQFLDPHITHFIIQFRIQFNINNSTNNVGFIKKITFHQPHYKLDKTEISNYYQQLLSAILNHYPPNSNIIILSLYLRIINAERDRRKA